MEHTIIRALKRGAVLSTGKRVDSLAWSRISLVFFILNFVLSTVLPTGTASAANEVIRSGSYDFVTELGGKLNCNYTNQEGMTDTSASSFQTNGDLSLRLWGSSTLGQMAQAEGRAAVGIKYIAPQSGRIKISTDVSVLGTEGLVKVVPPFGLVPGIGQVIDTALDMGTGAFIQSGVEIQAYRGPEGKTSSLDTSYSQFRYIEEPIRSTGLFNPVPVSIPTFYDQAYSSSLITNSYTGAPPALEINVTQGEELFICAGIKSTVMAIGTAPALASANVKYGAFGGTKVQVIKISYLFTEETGQTSPTTPTSPAIPSLAESCSQSWGVGQRVALKKGGEIRQGEGPAYPVHTIVPEDGWLVDVIGGPRCINGSDWWDISRSALDGGGTGWVNHSQATFITTATSPTSTYTGPEPPQYAPSFVGQTVSWNGNSFRSDNGTSWIFQGSDADRARIEAQQKARELAQAEALAQGNGAYLQKANLLELFNDINKNASDYGLADAEYVIIRGPYKATVYSDYRGGGTAIAVYSGEGTYRLPAVRVGSVRAEVIIPAQPEPLLEIPVPLSEPEPVAPVQPEAPAPVVNRKIFFASTRASSIGNNDIYSMNADGSAVTKLTQNGADNFSPAQSSDGSKIAFTSDKDGLYRIITMNADGTGQTAITPLQYHSKEASWSPDGTKIAFTAYPAGAVGIYLMNSDGTGITRLLPGSTSFDYLPSWSPDGSKLLFLSDRDGNDEIYTVNSDGSGLTRLTNTPTPESVADWSPDGTKIAFTTRRDAHPEVYVMNADGSNQVRLTNSTSSSWPSWLLDGKIIFSTNRDGNNEIYSMDTTGSNQINLTSNPSSDIRPN